MSLIRLALVMVLGLAIAAAPSLKFKRDPALLRAKQAQLIETFRARDPRAAAALARAFEGDVAARVAPGFRASGFSVDNVADMTAAYWIDAWEASHGLAGVRTDPAVIRGVRAQLAGALAKSLAGRSDAEKQDVADTMMLQAMLVEARMTAAIADGPEAIRTNSDIVYAEASKLLDVDLRAVAMSARGFTPVGRGGSGRSAPGAVPPPPPPPVARTPIAKPVAGGGRTAPVAGTYFRAVAGNGAAVDFEPLVLFANGEYVELGTTPLADLDAAADKVTSPRRWGRWQRQGGGFRLTGSDGRSNDYRLGTGNFFPAFTAAAGPKLAGAYSRTSGGGTFLPGGPVTVVAVDRLVFSPDGSFRQGKSAGGVASNAAIGNSSRAAGRWRLDGSALELVYADGRRLRTSFLWGATGSPPRPTAEMAFIGGDTFARD